MAAEPTYADRLRDALEAEDWSQAKLVRALADKTGNAVESERSAVRGYLQGATPRPARAAMIAEIMGLPDLAVVEHPRQSRTARVEDQLALLESRLEVGLARARTILRGQKSALTTQDTMLDRLQGIEDELRALRTTLEPLEQVDRTHKRSSRRPQ